MRARDAGLEIEGDSMTALDAGLEIEGDSMNALAMLGSRSRATR
jgi:hypothetical protein